MHDAMLLHLSVEVKAMSKAWRIEYTVMHVNGSSHIGNGLHDMNQGAMEDCIIELMQDDLASSIVIKLTDVTSEHVGNKLLED